jgi:myosin heavy subunit
MNTQEVIAKLNKYKEMLEQETDSDVRSRYQSKISQIEANLKEAEEKVEKLEEKVALEEKKELSEVEKKINKYKDFLESETDPDVKARFQKKIKELEDSLKEVKQEIKEEKKEVAEQKVEIKKAIKAVKSVKATKVEKKEAIQKVEKKVRERKEVSVKRTRRSKEIKRIIGDLDKLIEKNKKLKQKYTGKGVDVKKDASRSAKPFGYRFSGKHDYRVPTKAQIKAGKASGKVVYESRANRSDVYPKGQQGKSYAKLANGGEVEYTKKQIIYVLNDVGYEVDDNNFDELAINEGFKYKDGVWYRTDDFAKGGKTPVVRTQFEEEEFEYAKGGVVGTYQLMPYVSMGQMRSGNLSQLSTPSYKDKVMFEGSKDEAIMKANNMVNNSDEIISVEVSLLVRNGLKVRDRYKKIEMVRGNKMAHGGHTQGYDDREDERLAMKHGRMSKKDLDSTHARRDDARFEERGKMAKGGRVGQSKEDKARFAKPAGWRWKDSAVKKKIISTTQLSKSPTKAMREKYPNYVYFEDRLNKADKNPSRKYLSA